MKTLLFILLIPMVGFADSIVFTNTVDAASFRKDVDVDKGYPKPGVDIGKGIHATATQSQTIHHVDVYKHPTLEQYAVNSDGVKASIITKTGLVPTKLDATWIGAPKQDVVDPVKP